MRTVVAFACLLRLAVAIGLAQSTPPSRTNATVGARPPATRGAALNGSDRAPNRGDDSIRSQVDAAPPAAGVARFPLDRRDYELLAPLDALTLEAVSLGDAVPARLDLLRIDPFAPDARLIASGNGADRALPRPALAIFSGGIAGEADSRAVIGVSPYAVEGIIRRGDDTFIISSGSYAAPCDAVVYNPRTLPEGTIQWRPFTCAADELAALPWGARRGTRGPQVDGGIAGGTPCRVARIALETDREFTAPLFGGDTAAAATYATFLTATVGEIHKDEINTRFEISFLRVWDGDDIWTQAGAIDQLYEFRDYWNANMIHVQRSAAHFLSGIDRSQAGGVAYVGALCYPEYDYGLSAWLNGSFPYPRQSNHADNWDLMVVAHELGHNFGAPHTHSMSPPVDNCGNGDCTDANLGTIMSYCHTCPGGVGNIVLSLHPRVINEEILPFLVSDDLMCDLADAPRVTMPPQDAWARLGAPATLSVSAAGDPPLAYQWLRNNAPLTNDGRIGGVNTATLSFASALASDAALYAVDVTDACSTTRSSAAQLRVYTPGDLNCDGVVNNFDIDPFVLALTDPAGYAGAFPACTALAADVDGDTSINNFDIDPFVALLTQ